MVIDSEKRSKLINSFGVFFFVAAIGAIIGLIVVYFANGWNFPSTQNWQLIIMEILGVIILIMCCCECAK